MTIEFSRPEFHASVAEVRHTASTLSQARARASGEVSSLLDSWRGSAAEAFAEAWADWLEASASVSSALSDMADSLEQFQSAITTCDLRADTALTDLTRRLS